MTEQSSPIFEPPAEFGDRYNVTAFKENGEEADNPIDARYLISSKILGLGAFGTVHEVWDRQLGPKAAKVVSFYHIPERTEQGTASKPDTRATLREEAQMLAHLSPHPNVLRVEAYFETDAFNASYESGFWGVMITERKDPNSTLRERIKNGEIPPEAVPTIVTQIAKGVEHEYENEVVNRDLKPDNVFVTIDHNSEGMPEYWIQVADFGSGFYDKIPDRELRHVKGKRTGTPAYMSPERAKMDSLSLEEYRKSDVYTLGLITYEILTGKKAYYGDSSLAITHEIIRTQNTILDQNSESLARKLILEKSLATMPEDKRNKIIEVVAKSLNNDPINRYQSSIEYAEALDEAMKQTSTQVAKV